ncbi:hypothetical protein [Mesorhizobium sp. M1322]|uniref:hypothetical protein n=1 Tax=Mesorhizobium sp. M1322 TaxID=2957081 RepID=UPI00333B0608
MATFAGVYGIILPWACVLEGAKGSHGAANLYREGGCQPDFGKCPVPLGSGDLEEPLIMKIPSRFGAVAVAVIVAAGVSIASAAQLKRVQTPPGEHEMVLRRELAAARAELEIMQRRARDASAQAHALANTVAKQAQTLEEQQQVDEALETAQRVIEDFRAEALLLDRERASGAQPSMEASQGAAKRALDEARRKVEFLEQELTTARQTIDALKTGANLAAVEQANAMKDRSVTEAALKQAGEALGLERERADSAVRDLDIVRKKRDASKQVSAELSAALEQERKRAAGAQASQLTAKRALDEERRKVELLEQELTTARQKIDALKTGANLAAVEQANAMNDRSVVETALKQAGEALELERERADSAVRDLDIVRKERDASKQVSAELSAALEQERERAAGAQPSMAASQGAAKRALDEERRKVELLQQELTTARQKIDALKTGANLAAVEKTNAIKDRSVAETALKQAGEALELERERADSMEASQSAAKRALDEERRKVELLEQELTTARQTVDALKTGAKLAAVEQANAMKGRSVIDAALKQAGKALELERERADSALRDLDIVRKERDASKQVSAELRAALEQEREKAAGLARSLSAAREAIDVVKEKRRTAAVARAPKARTPASGLANTSRSSAQPAHKPRLPKKQKVKVQKSPHPVLPATIALPAALLPTRPLNNSTYASEDQ